jgi:hypothetical protein
MPVANYAAGIFVFYYNMHMAKLIRDGNDLVLSLSFWEKIGALHSSPRATIGSVTKIEFPEKLWRARVLRGIRAPGTGIPFVVLLGTMRGMRYRDFVAITGREKGVILTLNSGPFARWIFTLRQSRSEIEAILHDTPKGQNHTN